VNDVNPSKKVDEAMLVAAFPAHYPGTAVASNVVLGLLDRRYWWDSFVAHVEGQRVSIPNRLHFVSSLNLPADDDARVFVSALQTRSTDGFERQRALGDIIHLPEPWTAPFVVALIGEYIIEILDDIFLALTPELEKVLGAFAFDNPALWETTKRRVMSYWDVYYRRRHGGRGYFARTDYVGFRLVDRVEMAACRHRQMASQ
jgi:hypothetical protein